MPTRLRGRPSKNVSIVMDTGEHIRALTDELEELVEEPARAKVLQINALLYRAAAELGYPHLLDTPDEAA